MISGPGETRSWGAVRHFRPSGLVHTQPLWKVGSLGETAAGLHTRPTTIEPSLLAAFAVPTRPPGPVNNSCRPSTHWAPWLKPFACVW